MQPELVATLAFAVRADWYEGVAAGELRLELPDVVTRGRPVPAPASTEVAS